MPLVTFSCFLLCHIVCRIENALLAWLFDIVSSESLAPTRHLFDSLLIWHNSLFLSFPGFFPIRYAPFFKNIIFCSAPLLCLHYTRFIAHMGTSDPLPSYTTFRFPYSCVLWSRTTENKFSQIEYPTFCKHVVSSNSDSPPCCILPFFA